MEVRHVTLCNPMTVQAGQLLGTTQWLLICVL
jgi:hypothetical protein